MQWRLPTFVPKTGGSTLPAHLENAEREFPEGVVVFGVNRVIQMSRSPVQGTVFSTLRQTDQ